MKDEQLLKFTKLLSSEIGRKRSIYPVEVEYAAFVRDGADKRDHIKTDIFLSSLPESELNELREVIAMGSYFNVDKKNRIKRIASFPFDDPEKRKRILDVKHLNSSECISDIRKKSASRVIDDIESYWDIKRMSKLKRNFIRMIRKDQDIEAAVKKILG